MHIDLAALLATYMRLPPRCSSRCCLRFYVLLLLLLG